MSDASTAALFAGCWAEVRKVGAQPDEGQRLYELGTLTMPDTVDGELRRARADDDELVASWIERFAAETDTLPTPLATMRRRIDAGLVWIWTHDEPVAMASFTRPVAGVARIGAVYTPTEHRRHGYAAACTAAVSQAALDAGADRCILYTQLSNPQSNAIYRRLGYRPVQELIHYAFG
jgi:predicted GNAT family acetyltransferase